MWDKTRRQAYFQLSELSRLLADHQSLLSEIGAGEPDNAHRLALGATLNSFYVGIENIFKRIAKGIDSKLPASGSWHRDLLMAMAQATEERPRVISDEMVQMLRGYLDFRHLFREGYSFNLRWDRMADVALDLERTLDQFANEIKAFFGEDA